MNLSINNLISIFLLSALMIVGCDRIEDDAFPIGDALFTPDTEAKTITPGSSVIIDLSTAIQSSQPVSFRTGEAPSRGRVSFHTNGLMEYKPDDSFNSGSDKFTVEMVNADSVVLDADEFTISMVGDEADLPCFNGALGDFARVNKNEATILYPLINDGFCESEIESFSFNTEQPQHGEISLISPLELAYTPNDDYVGYDYFFYTLTLTDKEGKEFISTAKVEIEVSDEVLYFENCLEELLDFSEEAYFYPSGDGDNLLLELDLEDCLGEDIEVVVSSVLYGVAELDGDDLLYYPNLEGDSVDVISLLLVFDQDTLAIDLPVIIGEGPFDCEEWAFINPHLVLEDEPLQDVYSIDIFNEDAECAFLPWSIEMVEAEQGIAELGDSGNILWYPGDQPLDTLVLIRYNIVYEDGRFLERSISIYREDFFRQQECFEAGFPSQHIVIEELNLEYAFEIYIPTDDCELPQWDIEVIETFHGTVEISVDENRLRFVPDEGPNTDGYYGVVYRVILASGESLVREIIIEVDDSFHFECIEQFIYPETVHIDQEDLAQGEFIIFELNDECELAIDSLDVLESELGTVSFDGSKVFFSPNDQFVDHTVVMLMVVLPETGEAYDKLIEIILDNGHFGSCGEAAFPEQDILLDAKGQESYLLPVYFLPPDCSPVAWSLERAETTNGEVDIAANGEELVWYPNYDEFDDEAKIEYVVALADGTEFESSIELEFAEDQDCFEEAFPNQEIHLGIAHNAQFEIQVAFSHTLCLFPEWELDITEVSVGAAEFNSSNASIIYTVDTTQNLAEVTIAYNIVFDNGDFEPRELVLLFDETGVNCAEAFEDEVFYSMLPSDTSEVNLPVIMPLIIDPAANDQYCTDNYIIHILEQPDIGEAEVIEEGRLIQYQVFEEFAGRRETTIKYEICDSGKCDFSFINITVEQ